MPNDTALHKAAHCGALDDVNFLLEQNEEIDASGAQGRTPLQRALAAGNLDVATVLLGAGADITKLDDFGRGCLHYAAMSGSTDAVRLCLERGCDINAQTRSGSTALMSAALKNFGEICEVLALDERAEKLIKDKEGNNAYQVALSAGHKALAKKLKTWLGLGGGGCVML